ncbi:dGTP triphosphohydrolase [Aeoliella sp.]|uniref:dGTP triphosphohydrolase n=1 Tax=Aeoliella sp. TaxID=2795800 RepID=UPI003CCBBA15
MDRESLQLAPYAMRSEHSAGREHPESPHPYRSAFQRDRDRITHCAAFRRLSHKTQVFTGELGDYHRSRLTHTLEVSSVARTMARALSLNEDLVEALALLHDIGHPPFGHAGEDVLNERLAGLGGFNHNAQALRIVERLEIRYPRFPGLNLSQKVLEGQRRRATKHEAAGADALQPPLEVQVVDAADSIAYDAHDADDALELGLLTLDDLNEIPLWRDAAERVADRFDGLTNHELRRAVIHELIDTAVSNMVKLAQTRIDEFQLASIDDVRSSPPLLNPPAPVAERKRELQAFLFQRVYRHPEVLTQREITNTELGRLFDHYLANPQLLPTFFERIAGEEGLPRAVADWVSSHTDRSAREAYQQL